MLRCTTSAVWLSLLAVLSASRLSAGQECGATNPFGLYDVTPPSVYNGGTSSMGGCTANFQCSSIGILTDGNTASAAAVNLSDPNYLANFVAWNSSITRPYVTPRFVGISSLNRVELYFFHYPELNIGLPYVEVFIVDSFADTSGGTPVPYTLANNQNLSSSDMQVRRVTLLFDSGPIEQRMYRFDMSFSGLSNTDWVLLSEIRFCNLTQAVPSGIPSLQTTSTAIIVTPQDISSGVVEMTCAVASAGSFEWEWMKGNSSVSDGKFTHTTALSGRMSVLTISDLDPADSGMYTCQVNRVGSTATAASQSIALCVPWPDADVPPTETTPPQASATTSTESTDSSPPIDTNSSGSCTTSTALAVVLTFLATAGITVLIHVAIYIRFKKMNKRSIGQVTLLGHPESTDQPAATLERQDVVYEEIREEEKTLVDVSMEMDSNEAYANYYLERNEAYSNGNLPLERSKASDGKALDVSMEMERNDAYSNGNLQLERSKASDGKALDVSMEMERNEAYSNGNLPLQLEKSKADVSMEMERNEAYSTTN